MKKTLYVLPLLVASGFLAAPQANALTLDNGRNINGVDLNGRNLNGRNLNGRNINGRNLNGLAFNGSSGQEAAGYAATVILKGGERVTLR